QPGAGTSGSVSLQTASSASPVTNQTVTVTASGSGVSDSTATFTVTVTQPPILSVTTSQLNFTTAPGGVPADQTFQVQNSGGGSLSWTATASTTSGGSWLSVSPISGTAPSTLTVHATAASLAAGNYGGTITVTGSGAQAS